MESTKLGVSTEAAERVCALLQAALFDLIDLNLQTKQAHWNLKGSRFRSVHLQLDEILDDGREHVDDVAERITTLGGDADGRSHAVASKSRLGKFPDGFVAVRDTVEMLSERLAALTSNLRKDLGQLAELDPISEDLAIGVIGSLEKHQWMLRAQLRDDE